MGLPFVLDVAIGLIFIFLILSLLASELQELLATLLQWRAKHLKEAIEIFLAGGEASNETEITALVDKLYDDPLLKNINQQAKGLIAQGVRSLSRCFPGNRIGAFGQGRSTGPSYIAPETFATSLLERLGLATLTRKLTETRLERFAQRIVGSYRHSEMGLLIPSDDELQSDSQLEKGRIRLVAESAQLKELNQDKNFQLLVDEYADSLDGFKREKSTVETCVERMGESLNAYIANYAVFENQISAKADSLDLKTAQSVDLSYFSKRLKSFKAGIFGEKNERAIATGGLRPSLAEIAELVNETSSASREIAAAYQTLMQEGAAIETQVNSLLGKSLLERYPEAIQQQLTRYCDVEYQLFDRFPDIPTRLKRSLTWNQEQIDQRQQSRPHRRKRLRLKAIKHWLDQHWRRMTQTDLIGLTQHRRHLLNSIFDRLNDVQQQSFVSDILDRLPTEQQTTIIDATLANLNSDSRHSIISAILGQLILEGRLDEPARAVYEQYQTYKSIQLILRELPNSVKESFAILARRAQTRVQQTGSDLSQFREEISLWFDRSMSRASGVYKRNAKGVALLIGLLLAATTNTDTLFITDRLVNDESLRKVVIEQAIKLNAGDLSAQDLAVIKNQTDRILQELTLPIGWNPINLSQQLGCRTTVGDRDLSDWTLLFSSCLPEDQPVSANVVQSIAQVMNTHWRSIPKLLFGWLVSAIAISMGAPFWFDLLGKIVNVRNSGGKPISSEPVTSNNPRSS